MSLLALALFSLALALSAFALFPAEWTRWAIQTLLPPGLAGLLDPQRLALLHARVPAAAAGSLLLSLLLWQTRRRAPAAINAAAGTLRQAARWTADAIRPAGWELAALTAIALVLRLAFLNAPPRVDESTTYLEFASKGPLVSLAYYGAPNNHILHSLLACASTMVLGCEPWALRLPAFFAGVLMTPAAALAAASIYGARAVVPAAALAAICWPWVFYSANARGYTLAGLLFLLMLPLAAYVRRGAAAGAWSWLAVLAALSLFTVPVMLYALVLLSLWILAARPRAWRELAVAAVGVAALTLVLYAPALLGTGVQQAVTPEMTPVARAEAPARILDYSLALWRHWHRDLPAWIPAAFGAAALWTWRSSGLAILGAAWLVVALWIYPVMPYERLWLWLSLPWLLWAAAGLGRVLPAARWSGIVVVALALAQSWRVYDAGSIPASVETGVFREAGPAAAFLALHWQAGDGVQTDADPAPLRYEMRRVGLAWAPCEAAQRCWQIIHPPQPEPSPPAHRLGNRSIYLTPVAKGGGKVDQSKLGERQGIRVFGPAGAQPCEAGGRAVRARRKPAPKCTLLTWPVPPSASVCPASASCCPRSFAGCAGGASAGPVAPRSAVPAPTPRSIRAG